MSCLRFCWISALFLLALPAAVWAQFNFVTNDGSITITGYTGSGGRAVIPDTTNGLPVTGIASYAFPENNNLTNVAFGAGITNIGDYAFCDCTSLTAIDVDPSNSDYMSVDGVLFDGSQTTLIQYPASKVGTCYAIPSGIVSIGDDAFYDSLALTNVTIPDGVASIGLESFYDCENLIAINIPDGVTNIGDWAFWSCSSLTTITIPASVTGVGGFAFLDCVGLRAVNFEGNAPGDGGDIFDYDNGVTVFYLPGTTGWGATFGGAPTVDETPPCQFTYVTNSDAESITITGYTGADDSVAIPTSINGYPVTSIGAQAFEDFSVISVVIPNSITNIGDSAFAGCAYLTEVNIPNGVVYIGDEAFLSCYSLTSVVLPNSLTNIGYAVFSDCNGLTNVTIPSSVTSIGGEAFYECINLAGIAIPNSVISIGEQAFADCDLVTNLTIPASVTSIGDYAFAQCTGLTTAFFQGNAPPDDGTVFFNDPVTVYFLPGTTGWGATFGGVSTMEETPPNQFTWVTNSDAVSITITGYTGPGGTVAIPSAISGYAVTSLGMNAFLENMSLTNIFIPVGVTNIGDAVFGSCTNLTSTILPDSLISIGEESFGACFCLTNIIIPNRVTSIGVGAFDSCINLTSITIPASATNIGEIAFEYCVSMTNIFVDSGNPAYSSLNGVLFDKAQDTLIQCPAGVTNSAYAVPNTVVTIDPDALFHCANLAAISIPGSVTNILGPLAYDCTALTNICVSITNPAYVAVNGVLFDKAEDTLIQYPQGLANTAYTIPNSVTTIQGDAFGFCANLVSITVPSGVSNIGEWGTFLGCSNLTSFTIPFGVTNIPDFAFDNCASLTNISIPDSVTSIGHQAFYGCSSLTNVIIPASVTALSDFAFSSSGLESAYFEGNSPPANPSIFYDAPVTVYYLPGTSGWGATFGNSPTQLWFQPQPQVLPFEPSFGVQNHQFGFTISWATNANVIVQACTNLSNPIWIPVITNSLSTGTNYFSDPSWMNYPGRFYRISGP